MYLQEKGKIERSGKGFSESFKAKLEKNFDNFAYQGYKTIYDGDFGGAVNGKCTSWTCEQMKEMLDEKGLAYIDGEEQDIIEIGF